jgi:N-acyl-D-aspartate/D-glutamate deacylase
MARLVREALAAGALGFSSSRTILHRAKDGEVVPGTTAGDEELFGIGRAMGAAGHGVFEVASDLAPEAEELRWMSALSRETGRPVTFACLQTPADPDQWRRLLRACEADKAAGGRIVPQVAQRPAGLLLSFETLVSPFLFRPAFQALLALPPTELRERLRRPEVRAAIVRDTPNTANLPGVATLIASAWHMIFPLGDPPDYEPGPEKSVAAIAAREGKTPDEVAYDLLLERDCKAMLYLPLLGYANGNFDALREMMMHPQAVFGLSDGGAHCGVICDASSPTFLLTHWVRDRSRGARIPLEHAVAGQTRRTAELYGLLDRGALVPGLKADVNVIDLARLHIHAPEVVYDLPASARRVVQKIDGYDYTIVSGQVTYGRRRVGHAAGRCCAGRGGLNREGRAGPEPARAAPTASARPRETRFASRAGSPFARRAWRCLRRARRRPSRARQRRPPGVGACARWPPTASARARRRRSRPTSSPRASAPSTGSSCPTRPRAPGR